MAQEHDTNGNGNGTEIEATGPGGWRGRVKNVRFIDIVVAVCLIYTVVVGPYLDKERDDKRMSERTREHLSIIEAVKSVGASQRETTEALEELSYVVTLDTEERKGLNLAMPPSLRQKVYSDRRPGR